MCCSLELSCEQKEVWIVREAVYYCLPMPGMKRHVDRVDVDDVPVL